MLAVIFLGTEELCHRILKPGPGVAFDLGDLALLIEMWLGKNTSSHLESLVMPYFAQDRHLSVFCGAKLSTILVGLLFRGSEILDSYAATISLETCF